MPPVTLLIKPASSLCNLRCKYCFYHDVAANRLVPSYGLMPDETLETLVRSALDYADHSCTFAFQGGEPTLAGLRYYERLVELQEKYNAKHVRIQNTIQTNGTLIDDAFAGFLGRHGFLVGLSLDGGRQLHNHHRVDAQGCGTFDRAMDAARLFDRHNVQYNILCVVTNEVARHGQQVYRFMKDNHFKYLQFIPCLEGFGETGNPHAVTPQRYGAFLKSTFDGYYDDFIKGEYTSVRLFDNYVGMLAGRPPECCGMGGSCSHNLVVESDGSVYPCDFYVLDRYRLGRIGESSLKDLHTGERAQAFVEESRQVDDRCGECRWYPLCLGGCRRNREPMEQGKHSLNRYCESYQSFFEYAYPRMRQLAGRALSAGRL